MSEYVSLYRKYRPDSFIDLKGQEETVTTLINQIKSNKISHAYMLTGTRGTGKTSTAKLIAKAVNCLDTHEGEPCHKCSACLNHHRSMDIVEIDAASNRGIDDIRRIKDDVMYRPTENKYKVFIIDEVHMLTKEAYNALLKTLEEPPSYVIFILATTEFYKVPATIRSRCQKYEFNRIPLEAMVDRMQYICGKEGKVAETSALRMIALNSDGALRDALSMLEQAFAISDGMKLTESMVINMLGCSNSEMVIEFAKAILSMDIKSITSIMDFLIKKGKDTVMLLNDTIKILRDAMLLSITGGDAIIEGTSEYTQSVAEISKYTKTDKIIYAISELNSIAYKAKYQVNPLIAVETGLTLFCLPAVKEADYTTMATRLGIVEDKLNAVINSGKVITKEVCIEKFQYKPSMVDLEDYMTPVNITQSISSQPSVAQVPNYKPADNSVSNVSTTGSNETTVANEAPVDDQIVVLGFTTIDSAEIMDEIENIFPSAPQSEVTSEKQHEERTSPEILDSLKNGDPILSQLLQSCIVEMNNTIVKVKVSVPDFKYVLEDLYSSKFKEAGLELQVA